MSRTFSTRWLIPEGLTASAGAAGTSEILSVIAALPNLWIVSGTTERWSVQAQPASCGTESPEPATLRSAAGETIFLGIRYLQKPKAGTSRPSPYPVDNWSICGDLRQNPHI